MEWVALTISTYEDAPQETVNGYITIPISMLKELYEYVVRREEQDDYDYWEYRNNQD